MIPFYGRYTGYRRYRGFRNAPHLPHNDKILILVIFIIVSLLILFAISVTPVKSIDVPTPTPVPTPSPEATIEPDGQFPDGVTDLDILMPYEFILPEGWTYFGMIMTAEGPGYLCEEISASPQHLALCDFGVYDHQSKQYLYDTMHIYPYSLYAPAGWRIISIELDSQNNLAIICQNDRDHHVVRLCTNIVSYTTDKPQT